MSNGAVILPQATPSPATTDWVPIGPPGPGVPAGGTTSQALIKNSNTDFDTKWGPAGADLIYDGDYASGPTYKDGEIVVYQGIAYICTVPTTAPPSAWPGGGVVAQPPATVTSYGVTLPVTPYDGQEAVLVDSVTNPSYQWRFRYNAGSTSAYKWEFVGGAFAEASVVTDENLGTATSTWLDSPTPGPGIVVARAGEYQYQTSVVVYGSSGSVAGQIAAAIGAAAPTVSPHGWTSAGANLFGTGGGLGTITAAAGNEIRQRYSQQGQNSHVTTRVLRVQPKRVS